MPYIPATSPCQQIESRPLNLLVLWIEFSVHYSENGLAKRQKLMVNYHASPTWENNKKENSEFLKDFKQRGITKAQQFYPVARTIRDLVQKFRMMLHGITKQILWIHVIASVIPILHMSVVMPCSM